MRQARKTEFIQNTLNQIFPPSKKAFFSWNDWHSWKFWRNLPGNYTKWLDKTDFLKILLQTSFLTVKFFPEWVILLIILARTLTYILFLLLLLSYYGWLRHALKRFMNWIFERLLCNKQAMKSNSFDTKSYLNLILFAKIHVT